MRKKNEEKDITTKLIDLCIINEINESNQYILLLGKQAEFYQNYLLHLEETKPFFFQKKKLKKHQEEIDNCQNKIMELYKKMEEEIDAIYEMQESLKDK